MKNKKVILYIIILLVVVLVFSLLSIKITSVVTTSKMDRDYRKLELDIKDRDIEYYTVYYKYLFDSEYKVYKINNYYKGDSIDKIEEQLKQNNRWSKNKFYEYMMLRFYEQIDRKSIDIDRENLYYYNKGLIYAIIDVKNAKLYYLKNNIFEYHNDYNELLGIKINGYEDREIYSVKGQEAQNDGIDYYVYNFNKEKGKEIENILKSNKNWSKEKIEDRILECFKYNSEINSIKNAYYSYKKVYKKNNSYKKENNENQKETGYEIGVYDCDNNILYYYWKSI